MYLELDLKHVCEQITLIEEKAMGMDKALQARIATLEAAEYRRRAYSAERSFNQWAGMNRSEPVNVHLAVEPEQVVSIKNSCPSRRLGPLDGQESPPRVPREEGSGDGSVLRIEDSSVAELTTLLAELKIRVCQTTDGEMELTISRDGRVMVQEHVSD